MLCGMKFQMERMKMSLKSEQKFENMKLKAAVQEWKKWVKGATDDDKCQGVAGDDAEEIEEQEVCFPFQT